MRGRTWLISPRFETDERESMLTSSASVLSTLMPFMPSLIPESSLKRREARDDLVLRGVPAAFDDEATTDRRLAYRGAREREDDCGQEVFDGRARDRRVFKVNGEEVSRDARPELACGRADAARAVQGRALEEP